MEFLTNPPKIAIIYHSVGGRIEEMTLDFARGLEDSVADAIHVTLFQVPDGPLKQGVPLVMGENSHDVTAVPTLENTTIGELTINALNQLDEYDAVVFGITARFGMMSAQMKGVFDSMSSLWARGALMGKLSTCFFATGTQAGGQESTALTTIACMAHHGLIYVPTGYSFERMKTNTELNGGSPFGSGTFAGDGTRTPSDYEKEYAQHHGKIFGATVKALKLGQA